MQQKLLTRIIKPNENISFPIGTILAVKGYYEKLNLASIFGKFKKRGLDINSLTKGLLSYKLTENFSISKASDWINRKQVLDEFELKSFHEKTLFRALGIIGKNREEIIANIQTNLFNEYNFEHTDCNVDWTSLIIWGEMCKLAKHGFSKDHRPDKKQISLGISEIANPINVPIGITIENGNLSDMKHFPKSYNQIKNKLVDVKYDYQTKLKQLGEKEALEYVENEIEIKPLRVWTENSIYGAIIIGFVAQLFMSLIRYENDELKNVSIKFIKNSIMNLTVTVEIIGNKTKRLIYANFDLINELILTQNQGIP